LKKTNKKIINLKQRYSTIPYTYIDKKVKLYNGIWDLTFEVKSDMVGLKFGEFALTKRHDGQAHIRRKTKKRTNKKS
jgi:ribosomal protein S19